MKFLVPEYHQYKKSFLYLKNLNHPLPFDLHVPALLVDVRAAVLLLVRVRAGPDQRAAVDVNDASNIRITTGWWSAAYGGNEHNCIDMIQEEEDGTKYIELDIKGEGTLYPNIDEQHLLFTGSDYTLQEIYVNVWVEAGAAPSEIVLWSGEALADDWTNQPTFLTDAGPELVEAGAKVGQEVRFYITPTEADWKLKIVEGHWGPEYCAYCEAGTDTNGGEFTEWDLDANGGYIPLTLTDEILTAALTQQWWGGVFIANGDNVKVTKITLI